MTTVFTLALAQINTIVGDLSGNATRIEQWARDAARDGADLVLYPEMCLTGYPPEDLILIPAFRQAVMAKAQEIATATKDLPCDLMFGSVWERDGHIYNASLLASAGKLTVVREKHDLPNYGVFDEKRVFDVGAAPRVVNWRGIKLGVLICEEVWDVNAAKALASQGAEILLVQNASPYHIGKAGQRKKVVDAAVAATGLPVVYLNLIGGQDELVFDGRSYAVGVEGRDVARLPAFMEALGILKWEKKNSSPLRGEVRRGAQRVRDYPMEKALSNARSLRKNMTDAEQFLWSIVRREQLGVKFRKQHPVGKYIADFCCLEAKLIIELDGGQHANDSTRRSDAMRTEFLKAQGFRVLRFWNNDVLNNPEGVTTTINDILHNKNGDEHGPLRPHPNPPPVGEGMAEPLAIWQCTAAPMVEISTDERTIYHALVLGLRDYVAKNNFPGVVLGLSGGIDSGLTAAIAVDALGPEKVHTLRLPSPFTSDDSLEDAEQLAAALGIRMDTVPITPLMDTARQTLAPLFAGRHADTTEENVQARLRGLLLMGISNKFGAMVLTTGNKSEMSVGYATLYGDMCGGFSVLKDVYKTTVTKLSLWRTAQRAEALASYGFLGAASIPSRPVIPARMISKPPTAELRPNQRDEDSLPPYATLDAILRGLIERQLSVAELVAHGMDKGTVERVARMVAGAEYKRRQSAPGVKITPMAFGRDRRWPITNRWKFG